MKKDILEFIRQNPKLVAVQDYEITLQQVRGQKKQYVDGVPGVQTEEDSWWILLRLIHRDRPGFSVTTIPSKESITRMVNQAVANAEQSQADPWFRFPVWPLQRKEWETPKEIPEDFWKSRFSKLSFSASGFVEWYELWTVETTIYRRSEKNLIEYQHKSGKQSWAFGRFRESFSGLDWSEKRAIDFSRAAETMTNAKNWVQDSTQVFSLSPRAAAPLVEAAGAFFLANNVRSHKSPFQLEDLGKKCWSTTLSVFDDGLSTKNLYSSPFDLEGINSQKTPLISNGVLKGFLYDSYSGVVDNRLSTGNRIRDPHAIEARLGARALCVEPGPKQTEEIWQRMGDGIAIEGWSQQEITEGFQFYGRPFGWQMVGGMRKGPVMLDMVHWDLAKLFQCNVGIGNDLQQFEIAATPTLFFQVLESGERPA